MLIKIISNLSLIFFLGLFYHITHPMNPETIKLENKKIRERLRKIQTLALSTVNESEKNKNEIRCKHNNITLTSNDGKRQLVTIYIPEEGVQYYRTYKEFIQLMQEHSSDDENEGTFSHSNRDDGLAADNEQLLSQGSKEKKCCCSLI
jgi:hypothetical protein